MSQTKIPTFDEARGRPARLEGESVERESLKDKEMIVLAFREMQGDYGFYPMIQADCEGKTVIFLGTKKMLEQLKEVKSLPFRATLITGQTAKGAPYWVFRNP